MQMKTLARDDQGRIALLALAVASPSVKPQAVLDCVQVGFVLEPPTEALDMLSSHLNIELRLTEPQAEWLIQKLQLALQKLHQ